MKGGEIPNPNYFSWTCFLNLLISSSYEKKKSISVNNADKRLKYPSPRVLLRAFPYSFGTSFDGTPSFQLKLRAGLQLANQKTLQSQCQQHQQNLAGPTTKQIEICQAMKHLTRERQKTNCSLHQRYSFKGVKRKHTNESRKMQYKSGIKKFRSSEEISARLCGKIKSEMHEQNAKSNN